MTGYSITIDPLIQKAILLKYKDSQFPSIYPGNFYKQLLKSMLDIQSF